MEYTLLNILIPMLALQSVFAYRNYEDVRLCGDDYTTPGRCFVAVDQALDWHAADDHCKSNLRKSGHLAAIEDPESQNLVAGEVQRQGWEKAWINGCLKDRFWFWQNHWKWLSFQGCWKDYDSDYDLPIPLTVDSSTKPSDCLQMCKEQEKNFLSVQRDSNNKLMCRCGGSFGKHGRSYEAACDWSCPGSGGLSGGQIIDKNCGGNGHQLIYYTGNDGTTFHAWAQTDNRYYDNCAVFDHNLNHKWAERSCFDQLPFICDYDLDESDCTSRNSYLWVGGACITIMTTPQTFYEAQATCFSFQADLLLVPNAEVYNAVVRHLDSSKSYFFALNDEEWIFSYYQLVFRYFNWGTDQPAEGQGQDCFMMKNSDKKWYNVNCDEPHPFVCMVDVEEEEDQPSSTVSPSTSTTSLAPGDAGANLIGGLSKDLVIGIGAGAGGAVVIAVLIALCVCCILRQRSQKAERKRKRSGNRHTRDRQLPPTPRPKPSSTSGSRASGFSNTSYQPDLVQDHRGRGRPGTARSVAPSTRSDDYAYADLQLREYEELDRGSMDRTSSTSHPYDRMYRRNQDYLEPVESVRRY